MPIEDTDCYQLISGTVLGLRRMDAKINPLKGSADSDAAGWSSIAQAMLDMPGAVSSAELANDEGDPVEICSMKVGGMQAVGYFWHVGFNEGDEVEIVGTTQDSIFNVVALRKPRERMIWLRPHFSRGSKAIKLGDLARILKFIAISNLLWLALVVAMTLLTSTGEEPWMQIALGSAGACAVFDVACLFILRTPQRLDFGRKVDAVGRAFGMKSPEMLDFDRTYDLARAAGRPYLSGGKYY